MHQCNDKAWLLFKLLLEAGSGEWEVSILCRPCNGTYEPTPLCIKAFYTAAFHNYRFSNVPPVVSRVYMSRCVNQQQHASGSCRSGIASMRAALR